MDVIEQVQGTDLSVTIPIPDSAGGTVKTYTRSNPLKAILWRGDDQSPIPGVSLTWNTPSAGTTRFTNPRATSLTLEPAFYSLNCYVYEPGPIEHCFYRGKLRIYAAAGSGVPLKVYCSADDMAEHYPPINREQPESDVAGYAEQRVLARNWINRRVIKHYAGDKATIRVALDAGGLLATEEVREIAAKYALSVVLKARPEADPSARAAGRSSADQESGKVFLAEAQAMLDQFVAEVDLDDDQSHETTVDCREGLFVMSTPTLTRGSIRLGSRSRYDTEC